MKIYILRLRQLIAAAQGKAYFDTKTKDLMGRPIYCCVLCGTHFVQIAGYSNPACPNLHQWI